MSQDKSFEKNLKSKYGLGWDFINTCRIEVRAKIEADRNMRLRKTKLLQELHDELNRINAIGRNARGNKHKIRQRIKRINREICAPISFGGLTNLRRISYLSNVDKNEARKWKDKYKDNRILPICNIGTTYRGKGNRKFDFNLANRKVIFKPERKTKISIEFYCSDKQQKILNKLQEQLMSHSISVKLNNDYIWLIYDEEILNGFKFLEKEYRKELMAIPIDSKESRNRCLKKYAIEQEERKKKNKIPTRYAAFDLNPDFIGFCILDKTQNGFQIMYKEVLDSSFLNSKIGFNANKNAQIYQNRKRKYELQQTWAYLFRLINHYKAFNIAVERLNFKETGINKRSNQFNRSTKNVWLIKTSLKIIAKKCKVYGLKRININPAYSSFIGNIKYPYFDPLNAAIEIGRRGIYKYIKNSFYPDIERSDIDTMCRIGLDVQNKTISTWPQAYKLCKESGLRYRRDLKNHIEHSMNTYKSKIKTFKFE